MQMTASQVQGRVPVTIFRLEGNLDGSTYENVIAGAKSLYDRGARCILLDLSGVPYMSSAGIVALQTITSIVRGEGVPDPEMGWAALHSVDRDRDRGYQQQLKLLNPQPRVEQVLEIVGLKDYLEIYTDLDAAVASF